MEPEDDDMGIPNSEPVMPFPIFDPNALDRLDQLEGRDDDDDPDTIDFDEIPQL